ncbi:MAG: DUF2062 domain-containing protein [Proteobacteria bacterium]|nr:DUF2062 domain-containing protein [Pseudomonadota bacterium]
MKFQPLRATKYYYLRFIRLRGKPSVLARGVAVGIFVGITPTIPFHTILALIFAYVLRGSKIAALLATVLVSNPLTFFLQYYLSFRIGNWLTPSNISWEKMTELMDALSNGANFSKSISALGHMGLEALSLLLIGGVILAIPFTVASYVLSFLFFTSMQQKRREKHILK